MSRARIFPPSRVAWLRVLMTVVLLFAVVGCVSDEEAAPAAQLPDDPPWGLDTVELPTDSGALAAAFAAMPDSVDGVPRDEESATTENIEYSQGEERFLMIRAISTDEIVAFTGGEVSSAQEFVAMTVETDEYEALEASQLDETQPVVYVAFSAVGDNELMYGTTWAATDGNWVFAAAADTPEARTELIHAFIEACETAN